MNRSSPSARQAVEAAGDMAQRFAGDIEKARQNRAGIERRNGPGTRFSIEADTELEEKNITDGNAAVKSLIEQAKTSKNPESLVIENAMYRSDIGYIDLKWGTPGKGAKFKHGYGLAHIIAKRNAEVGNGEAVAYKLVEVIAKATDGEQQSNNQSTPGSERIKLHFDGYTAILSKNQEANKWLLTGWKDNETAANAVGEVRDSSNATTVTPIRTRRNGDATVSVNNIAHYSEESNTSEEKNPDAVDWEGNREQRLSVSDDDDGIDLSRYSGRDRVYMEAVKNGNTETAQRMVDEAAKRAGYDMELYHGSRKGGGFTVFKDWQYFTGNKAYAERYMERDNLDSLYHVYVKSERMFDTRRAESREIFEQMRADYGMSELQENVLPDWTDGYDISDSIEENRLDFDGVVLDEGGDLTEDGPVSRGESYIIRKSEQVKSAEPVTKDKNGKPGALSERFRTDRSGEEAWKNRDIRFSPAEEDDEIDWAGKETGEGRQIAGAAMENGGRPVTAPTEERGRPMTAPTETGEGRQIVFQSIFSLEMGFASAAIFSSVFSMCV